MPSPPKRNDEEESGRPSAKRVRTDEQLDRKRQKDRAKHKANRAESKTQLSNIENDVIQVRAHLELLLSKLGALGNTPPSQSSPSQRAGFEKGSPWADTQSSAAGDSAASESIAGNSPAKVAPLTNTNIPQLPNISTSSVCRCGIDHPITECPRYSGVALLFHAHSAMAANPNFMSSLPRSPTVANYMLMDDGNPVSKLLGQSARQFSTKNVETLWGFIFLTYRLFRVSNARPMSNPLPQQGTMATD